MPEATGKVKIVADSVCDLSPELLQRYDISILPLYVRLGDQVFHDTPKEIDSEKIYRFVDKTGVLPSTTAAPVGDYLDLFRPFREQGREIVFVGISSDFSSTLQNARIAAQELDGIEVVDSRNLSTGEGHVALQAARLAKRGLSAAEIARELQSFTPRVRASFILDHLSYMRKGGRCSSVAVLGANLLHIKPSIVVEDGRMHVGRKYRGKLSKVLDDYVDSLFAHADHVDDELAFITHTGCSPELVAEVRRCVGRHIHFRNLIETHAGSTVTCHAGPNTLGVLFVEK